MKTQADKHRRPVLYSLGDQVLLSSKNLHLAGPHQLSPPFIDPFPSSKSFPHSLTGFNSPPHFQIHNVFHVDLLKPYNFPLPGQPSAIPPPPLVADTGARMGSRSSSPKPKALQQPDAPSLSLGRAFLPMKTPMFPELNFSGIAAALSTALSISMVWPNSLSLSRLALCHVSAVAVVIS